MDKVTARFCLAVLKKLKKAEAEYWEARRAWYESGDGRPEKWVFDPETGRHWNAGGRGWTYPECIHGTSRWTDYDNICGGCEDGYSVYQLALWEGKEKAQQYTERVEWLASAPGFSRMPYGLKDDLRDWVMEPLLSVMPAKK